MARGPGDPRVRYIAVRIEGDPRLSRRALIDAIRITGRQAHGGRFDEETGTWLTRFDDRHAIIRCHHTHVDTVRSVLEQVQQDPAGQPLRLTAIATSGTIRTLVERHVPRLKDTGNNKRTTGNNNHHAGRANGRSTPPASQARRKTR